MCNFASRKIDQVYIIDKLYRVETVVTVITKIDDEFRIENFEKLGKTIGKKLEN